MGLRLRALACLASLAVTLIWAPGSRLMGEGIEYPQPDPNYPISILAPEGNRWQEGSYEVWRLKGGVQIRQGNQYAQSSEAVLWIDRQPLEAPGQRKIIAYLEGQVSVDYGSQGPAPVDARVQDTKWLGRYYSVHEPEMRVAVMQGEPSLRPPFPPELWGNPNGAYPLNQANQQSQPELDPTAAGLLADPYPRNDAPVAGRRIRFFPRSSVAPRVQIRPDQAGGETMVYVDNGLRLVVDGQVQDGNPAATLTDLAADRVVLWYGSNSVPNLSGENVDNGQTPLEVYMEGNIVFRQGERTIFAERLYYDVTKRQGIILDVELLTPGQTFAGNVRLRADVLEQLNENRFVARQAMLTTSRLGVPGYWFQAGAIDFQDEQRPLVNRFTGQPVLDPQTGQQQIEHRQWATSNNNLLYVNETPVLYWPTFATDLRKPTFYLKNIKFKQDRVFGTQVQTDWDVYQLLGLREPLEGTDWDVSVDYLSERGPALGTSFQYQRESFFGFDSPHSGFIDAWGIQDRGKDNLGFDRRSLEPEQDLRGRVLARHRQNLPANILLTGELGYVSDRNFLEQYFEGEWDRFKDQTTGVELKQYRGNSSWSLTADGRLNDFFSQTQGVRGDHYWIGQSLLADRLVWSEHTHLGYAETNIAKAPKNAAEIPFFTALPGEANADGEVLATRHELELPFLLGPVKLSPFVLGEAARWGEALDGDPIDRLYGRGGLRSSLPMSAVFPNVEDPLFNVHGLAHKLTWYSELAYSDTNRRQTELVNFEQLDDDAQEQFRRRFTFLDFGGVLPQRFDPRNYALRRGLGGNVTSPATEIADQLATLQFGLRQRLQTKRGPIGERRIVDWMVLDTKATYFPNANRDNFGESIGLLEYDYRWHLGDRLTFLSDGLFDFFDDGQKLVSVGAVLNRPRQGSLYLGFRLIQGPIDAKVVDAAYTYRMSPKWLTTFSSSYDLTKTGNLGQRFTLTRVGESFLFSVGVNVDASRNNIGAQISLEPRLFPGALANRLGASVPAINEFGFE